MKRLTFILFLIISINTIGQNSYINNQGFNVNRVNPVGQMLEFKNYNYFFWYYRSQSGGLNYVYSLAKYDSLGNYIDRIDLWQSFPTSSQLINDSTLIFGWAYGDLKKVNINGKTLWKSSSQHVFNDFYYTKNQIFAIGEDTSTAAIERKGIYLLSEDSGKILEKKYFLDYPEFTIAKNDSDFSLLGITSIDSSVYVIINRIEDTAKYVYYFNEKLDYLGHFEIEKDFFRILKNKEKLAFSHQRNVPAENITKGRLIIYQDNGTIDWEFEVEKDNPKHSFYTEHLELKNSGLFLFTHNYLKNGGSWQEVFKLNKNGGILKRYKLDISPFNPRIFSFKSISSGFLLSGSISDYEGLIIKTDSCFNASGKSPLFNNINIIFPDCGLINSNKDIFQIENELSIFPNPSNSLFYINNFNQRIKKIQLLDLNGIEIHSFNLSQTINLTTFQQGLYILVIEKQNGEIERHKIIKQ